MVKLEKDSSKVDILLDSKIIRLIHEQKLKPYPNFQERLQLIESFIPTIEGKKQLLQVHKKDLEELLSNPVILEILKVNLEREDFQKLINLIDIKNSKLKVACTKCDLTGSINLGLNITLNSKDINVENPCPKCNSKLISLEGTGKLEKNEAGFLIKVGEYDPT